MPAGEGEGPAGSACAVGSGVCVLCGCCGAVEGGSLDVDPASPEEVGDGPVALLGFMPLTSESASSLSCFRRLSCWAMELQLFWEKR